MFRVFFVVDTADMKAIGGITSALLYVGESTAMLSYPFSEPRSSYRLTQCLC